MVLSSIIVSRLFTLFVAGGISTIIKSSAGENTLLGEIGGASFGEGVGGSIADLFKEGSATAYEKILNQIAEPHQDRLNHHLNRAARKSQLLATFFACRGCLSEIEGDDGKDAEKKWLEKLSQSLAKRIKNIESENLKTSANHEDILEIFNAESKSIGEIEQAVIKKLQEETYSLIQTDEDSFPLYDFNGFALLKNCIENGWTEQETPTSPVRSYNWFSLMCGAFNDEYKDPQNFAAMQKIQNREILDKISESLGTNGASFDELYDTLKDTNKIVSRSEGKIEFLIEFVMRFSSEIQIRLNNIEKVGQETKENTERIAIATEKDFEQRFREKMAKSEVGTVLGDFIFVRPTRFFNRDEELKNLRKFILDNPQTITVIKGAGGYGKTSLADHFLKEIAPYDKISAPGAVNEIVIFNGQFDEITFEKIFDRAAELLERAFKAEAGKSVLREVFTTQKTDEQRIALLFEQLSRLGKVWFFLDNFESAVSEGNNLLDERLTKFLEMTTNYDKDLRLILTTREVPVFEGANRVSRLEMKGQLPPADAVGYLKQLTETENINWRIAAEDDLDALLAALSEKLCYIPKALFSFADYFKQDRERPLVLKKVLENENLFADFAKYDLEKGYAKLVGEQFDCLNALEKAVWFVLSVFKEPVSSEGLKFVLSDYDLKNVWTFLKGSGLIVVEEREIDGELYNLFSLDQSAQDYVYNLLPEESETLSRRELHRRAAEFYNSIRQPIKDCYTREQFAPYFNAIDHYYSAGLFAEVVNLFNEDILKLGALGYMREIIDRCLPLKGKLGSDELEINNHINLGIALYSLGKLNEAIVEYDKAIEIYEPLVEAGRSELANVLAGGYLNKGVALDSLGRLNEAIAEYDKAIEIREPLVEAGRSELANDLAKAFMNKGNALNNLGRLNEAIVEYDKAIEIYEPLVEAGRSELANDLAKAFMNKGVALVSFGRLNEAIIEFDKAIEIREPLVTAGRSELANDLAMAYLNKGNVLDSLGKLNEAIVEYDKAIEIYEPLVEAGRSELANVLAGVYLNKGGTLEQQNNSAGAVVMLRQAIKLWERNLQSGIVHNLPNLVKARRVRVASLIKLKDWENIAVDAIKSLSLFANFTQDENFSEHFKQQIGGEVYQLCFQIKQLSSDNREKIFTIANEKGQSQDEPISFGDILRQYVERVE